MIGTASVLYIHMSCCLGLVLWFQKSQLFPKGALEKRLAPIFRDSHRIINIIACFKQMLVAIEPPRERASRRSRPPYLEHSMCVLGAAMQIAYFLIRSVEFPVPTEHIVVMDLGHPQPIYVAYACMAPIACVRYQADI